MKKVLIIEDDTNIAELEQDYLKLNGYNVQIKNTGTEGLKEALLGIYNVIIIDLMLPEIDGFEIIKKIRAKFEIPIIVVSAKIEDIDKIRGLASGADDYMTKPFSPAELAARIRSHLNRYDRLRGKINNNEIISHRGLEINTSSHKVSINNKEICLTTKEYDLLLFLASNPNIVFTKGQLFDNIWGNDYIGADNATVFVHIQKLRKKIEKSPTNPEYIETLWGTGYRFNGQKY